eukprot:6214695-Pleurochrysis_carterae.AAC.2
MRALKDRFENTRKLREGRKGARETICRLRWLSTSLFPKYGRPTDIILAPECCDMHRLRNAPAYQHISVGTERVLTRPRIEALGQRALKL